ncbi:helicase HerA domain-containing protein [Pseudoalteromonas piscicida]|uniref:helicase HerA domain-containing protein n=1 Tax=Pseudoalteromonas piscicida TaxID=43662 RepID=UPI0030B7C0FD
MHLKQKLRRHKLAINPNNALKARHSCTLAGTGGGKSTAVKLMGLVGKHATIFDLYGEYKFDGRSKSPFNGLGRRPVYHFNTRKSFAKNFIDAWMSGKAFVVAYSPTFPETLSGSKLKEARQRELEWFAQLMWDASDGNRELDVVIEELAKLTDSIGKDDTIVGELATGGRKFGIVLHTVFQRSQEVPKTIWGNSPRKVLGAQEVQADAKRMATEFDADLADIIQISKLNGVYDEKRLYYLRKLKKGIGVIEACYIDIKTGKLHTISMENFRKAA